MSKKMYIYSLLRVVLEQFIKTERSFHYGNILENNKSSQGDLFFEISKHIVVYFIIIR